MNEVYALLVRVSDDVTRKICHVLVERYSSAPPSDEMMMLLLGHASHPKNNNSADDDRCVMIPSTDCGRQLSGL